MKIIFLLVVISVCSFLVGYFTKRRPIYNADKRKVIVKMWSWDYKEEKEVIENFEWAVDSSHDFDFYHTQNLRILIKGEKKAD